MYVQLFPNIQIVFRTDRFICSYMYLVYSKIYINTFSNIFSDIELLICLKRRYRTKYIRMYIGCHAN